MPGLFAGTSLERPVTCELCEQPLDQCRCPRDAAGRVLLPQQQTAIVRLDKRAKGKMVTLITGLDAAASDLPNLLRVLKSTCGAGGTIDQHSATIELQGDHRDRVTAALRSQGYKVKT